MKKTLLLLMSFGLTQLSVGQVFMNEDFSSYTIGNVGTDITGVTPGQGNYLTTSTNGVDPTTTTNSDNSNFQIVDDGGIYDQVLQMTGPNGDKGNRFMWQEGFDAAWIARTTGNDILEVEYDLFTGDVTTSQNNFRVYIFDAYTSLSTAKILCGFTFNAGSKVLTGVAYYNNTAATPPTPPIGNWGFSLGLNGTTPANLVLPPNAWVRIGMSYDYNTGVVKFKGENFNPTAGTTGVQGAAAMTNPDQVAIYAVSGTNANAVPPVTNSAAASVFYDNILVSAQATDSLLGVAQQQAIANDFSIYPNPITDFMNISNSVGMKSLSITDLNGRVVKSVELDNVQEAGINLGELASGVYIMNIDTDSGIITKKIIKN
ncbi:MAG TPA: T9SS type A sorting domain-containing protein [Flavobacterium sp.]|jgi:hypothetical protein